MTAHNRKKLPTEEARKAVLHAHLAAAKAAALDKCVAYYRVSTGKQARTGLGLDAQRERVAQHLNGQRYGCQLVESFTEVESGRKRDRPELAKALAAAKRHKAKLIVATMSRLTRDPKVLRELQDAGVDMLFCDLPEVPPGPIGRLILGVLAHVNEFEALQTGERTKLALRAAKARCVTLGNPRLIEIAGRGAKANKTKAQKFAANVLPIISQVQSAGAISLRAIARELNTRNVKTARGSTDWSAATVGRLIARAEAAA